MWKLISLVVVTALLAACAPTVTRVSTGGSTSVANVRNPGPTLEIRDNNSRIDVQCADRDVKLSSNNNVLRLRGQCGTLTITGNNNTVDADLLDAVVAKGNNNTVRWSAVSPKPQIDNDGKNNIIAPR